MEKKPVTRRDIAQRADTSVSVVSRALNNSGYVAKEKKERILKIAEELNYIPNPVAASLQARRVRQILFYCKNMENAFNIQLYQGMLEEAGARGYMVLFCGKILWWMGSLCRMRAWPASIWRTKGRIIIFPW